MTNEDRIMQSINKPLAHRTRILAQHTGLSVAEVRDALVNLYARHGASDVTELALVALYEKFRKT